MALGMVVGLGPGHIVQDGEPAPLPRKRGRARPLQIFSPFYCGQTAGCINMPLGMEVGLIPGDFVLDGDPAPPPKGAEPPIFGPSLLCPNDCMNQDATLYGGRPRPTRHCVRWRPAPPPLKGHRPQIFGQCPLWPNGWME